MSCLREVQTISKSPHILPMPSLTRLTTGGVLNPLKNTTNTSHNELLHQDPLQPPPEPRQLLYSRERFCVPSNVYLIGLMNTADRSLALLDYALRRRFAFFTLNPGFSSAGFTRYREAVDSPAFNNLVSCVPRLNTEIASDESLGEGFMIGHSYFCGFVGGTADHASLSAIIEYELVPMLGEYWFDEPEKVRVWSEALRRSIQ